MIGDLEARIEAAYPSLGQEIGWRLLYSPASTVLMADTVFIGLQPGGRTSDPSHGRLSCEAGSAYEIETWQGKPAGEAPLQKQVRGLCQRLSRRPAEVLSGNLVPFRAPSWADYAPKREALQFGASLWQDILGVAPRRTVIVMGRAAAAAICPGNMHEIGFDWGANTIGYCDHAGTRFVRLPHLSRFRIITRSQNQSALDEAFGHPRPA